MVAHALAGCQFDFDPAALQGAAIVARMGFLTALDETITVPLPPDAARVHGPDGGHQKDVTVIADPRALQVGVAEPVHLVIGDVKPAASIPALQTGVWTELDHAKRHRRSRISMAMPARADERVDLLTQRLFRNCARHQSRPDQGHQQAQSQGRRGKVDVKIVGHHCCLRVGMGVPGGMSSAPGSLHTRHFIRSWNPKC